MRVAFPGSLVIADKEMTLLHPAFEMRSVDSRQLSLISFLIWAVVFGQGHSCFFQCCSDVQISAIGLASFCRMMYYFK